MKLPEMSNPFQIRVLEKVLEVFEGGQRWTKNSYFRFADGDDSQAPDKFCLAGACCYAARLLNYPVEIDGVDADQVARKLAFNSALEARGFNTVPDFNDRPGRKYEDIEMLVRDRLAELRGARDF